MVFKYLWINVKFYRESVDDFHIRFHMNLPLILKGFQGFTQTHSPYYGFYENYLYLQLQMECSAPNKLKGSYQHYEAQISKRRHCKRH